ncbi:hypothetical protein F442_11662 [Phytophthora nicotianae P10297]|uniref:Uncharacterized protein n=1 Tax=Phytophthora nicotianae P10297 TaxID=1317064 RepID=W2Z147_PHYNI|nr:hypothetical protein F442_11662 [Phytophthora nicotianae P10297]
MWLAEGRVPRLPVYVLVGSRRYAKWQKLAYQAAADEIDDVPEVVDRPGPAVERPSYTTPTRILARPPAISPGSRAAAPRVVETSTWCEQDYIRGGGVRQGGE